VKFPRITWWTYLILAPWVLGIALTAFNGANHTEISERERTTTGRIIAHEIQNHNQYRYVFSADGKEFTGLDSADERMPAIGDSIEVFYDPRKPSENALRSFRDSAQNMFGSTFGIFALLLVAAFWIEYFRRQGQSGAPVIAGDQKLGSDRPRQT
jgi:hypothetical protein